MLGLGNDTSTLLSIMLGKSDNLSYSFGSCLANLAVAGGSFSLILGLIKVDNFFLSAFWNGTSTKV